MCDLSRECVCQASAILCFPGARVQRTTEHHAH